MKSSNKKHQSIFDSTNGNEKIKDILLSGNVFRDLHDGASLVSDREKLRTLNSGEILLKEDDVSDDVYFILTGRMTISVNGQPIAERGPGDIIGEMALLDKSPKRSATVAAKDESVVLCIPNAKFHELELSYPKLWKGIARELALRLKQRNLFVPCANSKPAIFVGSSAESLPVQRQILVGLDHDAVVHSWTKTMGASSYTLDDLIAKASGVDFAAFIFAPDDVTQSRGKRKPTVRDNVLFEAGLFIGSLGRKRVFFVKPRNRNVSLPSDLSGIKTIDYAFDENSSSPNLSAAIAEIIELVRASGCRTIRPERLCLWVHSP